MQNYLEKKMKAKRIFLSVFLTVFMVLSFSSCELIALMQVGKAIETWNDSLVTMTVTVDEAHSTETEIALYYEITTGEKITEVKCYYKDYYDYNCTEDSFILLNGKTLGKNKTGTYKVNKNGYYYFAAKNSKEMTGSCSYHVTSLPDIE